MAQLPRTKQSQKASPVPYVLHFGLFVGAFFALIGGALFVLNLTSSFGA